MTRLRAVAEGEKPSKVESLDEAIASGDQLRIMLAQRREIARDIKRTTGPANAALHRQLTIITKDIAVLEAKEPDADDVEVTPDEGWDSEAI